MDDHSHHHSAVHVLNYAWPHIDGYCVRSAGLITAQAKTLGYETRVVAGPYMPFAHVEDRHFSTNAWQAPAATPRVAPVLASMERPSMGLTPFSHGRFVDQISSEASAANATVIHGHHPHFIGAAARDAARRMNLPFVYEVRCFNGDYDLAEGGRLKSARGRWINSREFALARQADAVVTLAPGMAERLIDEGVGRQKIHIVRNAVDTDFFDAPAAPVWPGGTLKVGYATTFEDIENLDTAVLAAIEAAQLLKRENITLELHLAGKGRDWARIEALVQERDTSGVITLTGFVPYHRMPAFYKDLDVFLVPRKDTPATRETTPLKPLEAAASGLPILASDLPALRALLGEGKGVRYFTPDVNGISAALVGFANSSLEGGIDVSKRAWSREVLRYRDVYEAARAAHGSAAVTPRSMVAAS